MRVTATSRSISHVGTISVVAIIIIIAVGGAYLADTLPATSSSSSSLLVSSSSATTGRDSISIQFSLCASNCGYPSPYLSGDIFINGSVPISSITMYINGTYNGFALQNPGVRPVGPCSGVENETCTIEAGATCLHSPTQTTCTYQYASCFIGSGSTSCTATLTGDTNTLTVFDQIYKGSVASNFIPVIPNDKYVIACFATFEDNSVSNATTIVVAT